MTDVAIAYTIIRIAIENGPVVDRDIDSTSDESLACRNLVRC
jgi:hypothetical protein